MVEYAILLFFVLQHYIKHCKTVMCFGNFVFCTFLSFEKQFSKDAIIKSIICVMVACTFHRTAVLNLRLSL